MLETKSDVQISAKTRSYEMCAVAKYSHRRKIQLYRSAIYRRSPGRDDLPRTPRQTIEDEKLMHTHVCVCVSVYVSSMHDNGDVCVHVCLHVSKHVHTCVCGCVRERYRQRKYTV